MFFDHVRALFGPLPSILCRTGTFIRVFCGSNILVLTLIITGTKFLLVCIFRSIPLMDDNFLSFTINIIVNIVIFLATMSKFYIEDRPNVAEVIDNFLFSCRLFVCLCLAMNYFTFSANLLRKMVWCGTRRHHHKNSNGIIPILYLSFWAYYISHLHGFWESCKEIWKKENQQEPTNTYYVIGNIEKHFDREIFILLFYGRNCNCWKVNTVGSMYLSGAPPARRARPSQVRPL